MTDKVRSLLEQAIQSAAGGTNSQVRSYLELYSTSEVDAAISAIDLSPYATNATVASISGDLAADIATNAADLVLLQTDVANISGDLVDVDLSLTAAIDLKLDKAGGTVTGDLTVSGNFIVNSTNEIYLGDEATDGSWRFAQSGSDLVIQRRESSVWVTKSTITA